MKMLQNKDLRAFSLLEILVSIALLSLLFLLLATISTTAISFWHRLEAKQKNLREASAALQLITSDLRSAIVLKSSSENYFFTAFPNKNFPDNSTLFFLAALPKEKRVSSGDCCAVGYFLAVEKNVHETAIYDLYRFYLSSEETVEAMAQSRLLEHCSVMTSPEEPHCERIASNISRFQATPIWYEKKSFSFHSEQKSDPPAFVQIVLETSSPLDPTKKESWSTLVTLPFQKK